MSQSPVPASAFADVTPLLNHLPPVPPAASIDALQSQLDRYGVKPGPLLPVLTHLQMWQNKTPVLGHPRLCVFASAYDDASNHATAETIAALQSDGHPLKQLAAGLNADLRVYELDLTQTQRTAAQAAQAMIYGMLAIEDKGDVVVIATLSAGAEQAANILDIPAEMTADELLNVLVPYIGLDFFAGLGACLAARLAGQPVLVSGAFGQMVMTVLDRLHADAPANVYVCAAHDVTATMPPVFACVYVLQQAKFLLSFLPLPLKTVHIQSSVPTNPASSVGDAAAV